MFDDNKSTSLTGLFCTSKRDMNYMIPLLRNRAAVSRDDYQNLSLRRQLDR